MQSKKGAEKANPSRRMLESRRSFGFCRQPLAASARACLQRSWMDKTFSRFLFSFFLPSFTNHDHPHPSGEYHAHATYEVGIVSTHLQQTRSRTCDIRQHPRRPRAPFGRRTQQTTSADSRATRRVYVFVPRQRFSSRPGTCGAVLSYIAQTA